MVNLIDQSDQEVEKAMRLCHDRLPKLWDRDSIFSLIKNLENTIFSINFSAITDCTSDFSFYLYPYINNKHYF